MRVFVTGATGFIGDAVVDELRAAGHQVLGMARNDAGAEALKAKGIEVHRAELTDPDSLVPGVQACDGVIHLAFIHEFDKFLENIQTDRKAVEVMLAAMEGTNKPFILTSGTAAQTTPGHPVTENDPAPVEGFAAMRGATETFTLDAAGRGIRSAVVRLPQVHDTGDKHGFVSYYIEAAKQAGAAMYIGEGANHWPAAHRSDVARLYRLAVEKAEPRQRLHAVGEEGVRIRDIAEVVGEGLGVPTRSVTAEEAAAAFGFLGMFMAMDNVASSAITQQRMGWTPTGPKLLDDLRTHSLFKKA